MSKTLRHNKLVNFAAHLARGAPGFTDVRVEGSVEIAAGVENRTAYRSDLDFVFKGTHYRLDFAVTSKGMPAMERKKISHYKRVQSDAATSFVFIPVVASSSLAMTEMTETVLRFLAERYQIGILGTHTRSCTTRILGNAMAGLAERQLTLYRLMVGERSTNPDVLFNLDPLPSDGNNNNVTVSNETEGTVRAMAHEGRGKRDIEAEFYDDALDAADGSDGESE
jgi:hypothetical protein